MIKLNYLQLSLHNLFINALWAQLNTYRFKKKFKEHA